MVETLIALASVVSYMAMGAWTFGYSAANMAANYNAKNGYYDVRQGEWYHDELPVWFATAFWPVYLTFNIILGKLLLALVAAGDKRAVKSYEARKVRIQLEERIRVEQQRIEQEVTEEVEETLRQRTA